jgi:hypothetical protein
MVCNMSHFITTPRVLVGCLNRESQWFVATPKQALGGLRVLCHMAQICFCVQRTRALVLLSSCVAASAAATTVIVALASSCGLHTDVQHLNWSAVSHGCCLHLVVLTVLLQPDRNSCACCALLPTTTRDGSRL